MFGHITKNNKQTQSIPTYITLPCGVLLNHGSLILCWWQSLNGSQTHPNQQEKGLNWSKNSVISERESGE